MNPRRQRTIRIVLGTLLAGAAAAGPATSPAAADPPAGPTATNGTVAPDEPSALAAARRAGTPVEVLSRRTERERTFANPDGSWTSEITAAPTRVRRPGGAWVGIDTTLRRASGFVEAACGRVHKSDARAQRPFRSHSISAPTPAVMSKG